MSKSQKRKAVETTEPARSNVRPLVRQNLGMPEQPEQSAVRKDPEVSKLAATIGQAWTLEKANECYLLWDAGTVKATASLVLMAEAYQSYPQRLSIDTLNALYRMHRQEDSAGRFIREFRAECRALGKAYDANGNIIPTHFLSIVKPAKSETVQSKVAAKERAGGNRLNESSVLNKCGDYAVAVFTKDGKPGVEAFAKKVAHLLAGIASTGEFQRLSNKKTA